MHLPFIGPFRARLPVVLALLVPIAWTLVTVWRHTAADLVLVERALSVHDIEHQIEATEHA